MARFFVSLLAGILLLTSARAKGLSTVNSCACGYVTNTNDLFQYSITTEFNGMSIQDFRQSSDWAITSIVYGTAPAHPYAVNYTTANVDITNNELQLTCSAYDSSISTAVASAQILTRRDDILHGSFRASFSVDGGSNAIGALFFYADDTHETDIELLTRDSPRNIHFSNQPDTTEAIYMPNGLTRSEPIDYRLDWTSASTKFYVNDVLSATETSDVPTSNGSVYLNMWANGGGYAGSPPPSSDATMRVREIKLYFNTSSTAQSSAWEAGCQQSKVSVCAVDQQGLQQNITATSGSAKKMIGGPFGHRARRGKKERGSDIGRSRLWKRLAATAGTVLHLSM